MAIPFQHFNNNQSSYLDVLIKAALRERRERERWGGKEKILPRGREGVTLKEEGEREKNG